MSTPAVETLTDAPVETASTHVAEKVDEHTPETPAPPKSETVDPTQSDDALDVLQTTVTELATAVATLTNTVAGLGKPDESPHGKLPWTARGGKHDHNDREE